MAGPWTSADRPSALARLGEAAFDVVVVGGGITGCGVALDAAARGLSTALVEGADFAWGTSSRSSKLVHGGLRYLAQHDYRLVYEALAERQRLLANAPHLVRPLPFLVPLFGRDGVVAKGTAHAYSAALWLYDLTGGLRMGRRHRRVDATTALRHFPPLLADQLVAGFLYWDAQADDARLTWTVARTAAAHGAAVVNHAPVTALLRRRGGLGGVVLADGTEVTASVVVNAGGVWAADIARLEEAEGSDPAIRLRPAKGVHVTVPAERLPCEWASVLPVPGDKRTVFVVPWVEAGFTYVGTTDTDYDGPLDSPACTAADIDYLLGAVNKWTSAGLRPADVSGSWAGLRPLVADAPSARTADLSRRHQVSVSTEGLVTVTGGKLTTYREMAADTVDEVVRRLGGRSVPSPTRRLPLWGAEGTPALRLPAAAGDLGLDTPSLRRLVDRYGGQARAVAAMIASDGSLGDPLVPGLPYTRAEAVFAARYEMATSLEDVLCRRTRAFILDREATASAAGEVARLLAPELGWSGAEVQRQASHMAAMAAAERRAAQAPAAAGRIR